MNSFNEDGWHSIAEKPNKLRTKLIICAMLKLTHI